MYRSTLLAPSHYAGKWIIPDETQRNDLAAMNQLGYDYGVAVDSPAKEALLLLLLERFHGYLMKYVCMVVRGTLPSVNSHAGKDAKEFLRTLAARGLEPSKELTDATCKTLHLAFKGATTEDIYDTLAFCFVKAARRYDPHYALKTKKVCQEVTGFGLDKEASKPDKLASKSNPQAQQFTFEQIAERVDFDSLGILRALVRKGFLSSITGKKKVVGYKLGPKWPPPASYFQSGLIGLEISHELSAREGLNRLGIFSVRSTSNQLLSALASSNRFHSGIHWTRTFLNRADPSPAKSDRSRDFGIANRYASLRTTCAYDGHKS
jgi:hypothetical protein